MSLVVRVILACLVACAPRLVAGSAVRYPPETPIDDLSLTFGDEAIPFAGVSSLICPEDTRIACVSVERYVFFALQNTDPERFGMIWAFKSLLGNQCISLERHERCGNTSIAYGICTSCEVCTSAGYGWCDKAHLSEESNEPYNRDNTFAPLCFDASRVVGCPYSSSEPVTVIGGCPGFNVDFS